MQPRKNLSELLLNSEREQLEKNWDATEAAESPKPLPAGDYRCRIVDGQLSTSSKGTPGYKLTLEVIEDDHKGRRIWHDIWLSPAALGMAKRDLGKLGVTQLKQLEQPIPEGFIVDVRVVLRRFDEGPERNQIARFNVVSFDPPAPEPFPPGDDEPDDSDPSEGEPFDWANRHEPEGRLF